MTVGYARTQPPCPQQQNAINLLDSLINDSLITVYEVDRNGYVTWMEIWDTTISALPSDFGSLFPELNRLHLGKCRNLTDVSSIGGMRKLRELFLWMCPVLRAFPEELCERLKRLELACCNAFDYDSSNIRNLEGLEEFVLVDHDIDQVPLAVWSLSNLKMLHLRGSRLTSIPNEIGNLAHLKELRIDGKRITSLSREIGALAHLKFLAFCSKQEIELPDEMGALTALESVDFACCGKNLKRIPAPVLQLPNLEYLDLTDCSDLSIPIRNIFECTDSLIEVNQYFQPNYSNDFKRSLVLLQHMAWLNKKGRYLLKKKRVSLALWGAALVHWSSNVNCLFFFLKQKPDVIPQRIWEVEAFEFGKGGSRR